VVETVKIVTILGRCGPPDLVKLVKLMRMLKMNCLAERGAIHNVKEDAMYYTLERSCRIWNVINCETA
jgi:hypothetical protein